MDKAAIRAQVRSARRARPTAEIDATGVEIAARVMALDAVHTVATYGGTVAVYLSMSSEPPTEPLVSALLVAGVTVVSPRVVGDAMEWVVVAEGRQTTRSALGIDEPVGSGEADLLSQCDVVVLPALGIDRSGRRLGQGGGFYDRALGPLNTALTRPFLVALVFDDEIVDELPVEPHDVPVDAAVTPTRVLRFHTPAS